MKKYNEQLSSLIAKTSIIKDRDVLKNLKPNDFKNILIYINSQLTDNAVNECLYDYMEAGDVVSPTTEVKNYVISNLFELIQKSDDKTSGELLYYIILDLHIFKDGNGRTSRAIATYILMIKDYDLKYMNQESTFGGKNLGITAYPSFNAPDEIGDNLVDLGFNMVTNYLIALRISPTRIMRTLTPPTK